MDSNERRKRLIVFATFLFNCLAVALLSAALGTDYWIVSRLRDFTEEQTTPAGPPDPANNDTVTAARQMYTRNRPGGLIHFGLFHGFVRHNKGLGEREAELKTVCEDWTCSHLFIVDSAAVQLAGNIVQQLNGSKPAEILLGDEPLFDECLLASNVDLTEIHRFNFGLWAATTIFTALGITLGIISAIYSLINTTYTPVSPLNGLTGLYLWNATGILFTFLGNVMWLVIFYEKFRYNVLPAELLFPVPKFTTCGIARLGYSFWLCVTALLTFALNVILLALKDVRWSRTKIKLVAPSRGENLFMY